MKNRRGRLGVLTYNGHVGIAIHNGGIEWLLRNVPGRVHLILLQEAKYSAAYLREQFGGSWHVLPGSQIGASGTYVLALKRRFAVTRVENKRLVPSPRYERAQTVAVLRDRRTGRRLVAASLHVDPLGQGFFRSNRGARAIHEEQIEKYVDRMTKAHRDAVAIVGGDFNENLDDFAGPARLVKRTAVARLGRINFRPAYAATRQAAHLDDVFVRDDSFVRVTERVTLTPPVTGNDHPAVYVSLDVDPLA